MAESFSNLAVLMDQAGDGAEEFTRRVIGLERYFYRRPNPNVIMVGRFRGECSASQLEAALEGLRRRHPMLGVRVVQKKEGDAYFTTKGGGRFEVLEQNGNFDEKQVLDKARQELMHRHRPDQGPLVRFILMRSPERFDLVINSHHMICDGLSLYYLLMDIHAMLSEPDTPLERREPVCVDSCLPSGACLKRGHTRLIRSINRTWEKKGIIFSDRELEELHGKYWCAETGLDIIHWKLDSDVTRVLVGRCKSEGASVHSALATAFLMAQREVQGRERYLRNISMPVSIRDRLSEDAGESFGLYYSSFKLEFKYPRQKDFWEAARAVHKHIRDKISDFNVFTILMQLRELHPTIVDSISFTRYGLLEDRLAKRLLKLEGGYTTNTGLDLSNIGVLDAPKDNERIELVNILGPMVYNEFQQKYTGVLTFRGELNFTITFCRSRVSRDTVLGLRDSVNRILSNAIQ